MGLSQPWEGLVEHSACTAQEALWPRPHLLRNTHSGGPAPSPFSHPAFPSPKPEVFLRLEIVLFSARQGLARDLHSTV